MAEGKREYVAIFSIGARLLGSFKGAMGAAQARLRALGTTAKTAMTVLGGVAVSLAGIAASIAGAAIGTVLKKVFSNALDYAKQAEDHHRRMLAFLRTDMGMRKKGSAFLENQARLLDEHNEKLAKTGVISADIYGAAQDTLITYGAMPHHLAEMSGPLGDMLAALKGPAATMGDMTTMTHIVGRAIEGGPLLQLEKMGLAVNKTAKEWHEMTKQARFETLLKSMKQFEGEAARQMNTPLGKMRMYERSIEDLSQTVGDVLLPVLGDCADAMRRIIIEPGIKPAIEGTLRGVGKAAVWATQQLGDFLQAIQPKIDIKSMEEASGIYPNLTKEINKAIPSVHNFNMITGSSEVSDGFNATTDAMNAYTSATEGMGATHLLQSFQELGSSLNDAASHMAGITTAMEDQKPAAKSWGEWMGQVANDVAESFAKTNKATIKEIDGISKAWQTAKEFTDKYVPADPKGGDRAIAFMNSAADTTMSKMDSAWGWVKDTVGAAWKMKPDTPWEGITGAASKAFDGIKGAWDKLTGWIGGITLPTTIWDAVSGAALAAFGVIKQGWLDMVSSMQSVNLPAVQGPPAPVPGAAFGGIFKRHSLMQIAENGPEAVIPLSGGRRAQGLLSYANRAIGTPAAGPTNVSFAPVVTINGNATEQEQRAMDSRLRDLSSDFIAQFKAAQYQERRLSYESGYG